MAKYDQTEIAAITTEPAWQLANRADISTVETEAATEFLESLRDSVLALTDEIDAEDWDGEYLGRIAETADSAPSVYTWTVWQEFVGLSAWQFDPDWDESETATMEDRARVRLYVIAEMIASSIARDISASVIDDN